MKTTILERAVARTGITPEPNPACREFPVLSGPSGVMYRLDYAAATQLDGLEERMIHIIDRLRWSAHARGHEAGDVTVQPSLSLAAFDITLMYGRPLKTGVGYDDMGTPCEEYPR